MKSYITTANGPVLANPSDPQLLQADLQAALGNGFQIVATNNGVSGATLCMRMNGTGLYTTKLADDLKADGAQIVLENFGMNDANPAVSGSETPTEFQQCLEAFVDTVRAAGKIPVIEEPNPVSSVVTAAWLQSFNNTQLPNYIAVIDSVTQEKGVALVQQFAYIQSLPNWESLSSDGVHPSQALYAIKAQREADIIAPIIKGL